MEPTEDPYIGADVEPDEESPDDPQPPQDIAAEQAVLGSVMLSPGALDAVSGVLTPGDFYRPAHGVLWASITALAATGHPTDAVAVSSDLDRRGELTRCGGAPYLHDLIRDVATTVNVEHWAGIVTEKATLRRLAEAGMRIQHLAESGRTGSDVGDVVAFARRELDDAITSRTMGSTIAVSDLVWPWLDGLNEPPAGLVPTPWPELDDLTNGGVRCGELVIIAGSPGSAKTMTALAIARGAAQERTRTAVFSLEMTRDELISRLVADMATVPLTDLISHHVRVDDRERVKRAVDRLAELPLLIDDTPDVSVPDIRACCRRLASGGLGLVVIDGLWLLRAVDPRAQRQQQIADMTRPLKVLAKELGIPVVLVHQLNREPTKRLSQKPSINDLRDSGAPTQDADKILLTWRQEDKVGELTIIVGKHRNGPTGEVVLDAHYRYARISSGDPYRNMGGHR